jgi:hypothetical protein
LIKEEHRMPEEFFEHPGRHADDAFKPPDLTPLRATAEREELTEARGPLADGLGNPLPVGDPRAPLAHDVVRALTEAGFTLHHCVSHHPLYRLDGVCVLPVPSSHNPDGQGGIAVSWTTHDLLALGWQRERERQDTQQTMNRALANALTALDYQVQPFGTGGAALITTSRSTAPAATRRTRSSRGHR